MKTDVWKNATNINSDKLESIYATLEKQPWEIIDYHLFLLGYWAYLLKSFERIMTPYFILLHVTQMAIRSNKYTDCIGNILPANSFNHKLQTHIFANQLLSLTLKKTPDRSSSFPFTLINIKIN